MDAGILHPETWPHSPLLPVKHRTREDSEGRRLLGVVFFDGGSYYLLEDVNLFNNDEILERLGRIVDISGGVAKRRVRLEPGKSKVMTAEAIDAEWVVD